jgi:aryl-alcohol dehydrogenase-like predicted oxidoreductase
MTSSSNRIGLGTVQFGLDYGVSNKQGQTHINEVRKIIETAKLKGLDLIDTASAYGNAEEVLGQFDLSVFKVVSKFMPSENVSLDTQLLESLKKLKIDKLYGYLAHRPLSLLKNNSWEALKDLKAQGLVEKIGYSLNEPSELDALLNMSYFPDIIQVPFNYLDNRFVKHMMELKDKGCEIHTRSTFLQGLFFMNPDNLISFFDEVKPLVRKLQKQYDSLQDNLLNYVLNKEFIDKVIIGVENNKQFLLNLQKLDIKENLPQLNIKFSDKILMPMYWPKNKDNE